MTRDDAKTIVQSLVRSVSEEDSLEDSFRGTPHLEWVLITSVERPPHGEEDSPQPSAARMMVTFWVTPIGLLKSTVGIANESGALPFPTLWDPEWPFPEQVTMIGLEHWATAMENEPGESLITTWSFRHPDEKLHLIKGVPVPTRHLPNAGAEEFARSLAGKVGWQTIEVQST